MIGGIVGRLNAQPHVTSNWMNTMIFTQNLNLCIIEFQILDEWIDLDIGYEGSKNRMINRQNDDGMQNFQRQTAITTIGGWAEGGEVYPETSRAENKFHKDEL